MTLGIWELLLLLVVVLLLFGTGKLTRAMGDLARGVRSFRDEMKDTEPSTTAPSEGDAPSAASKPQAALPAPGAATPHEAVGRNDQPARP